MGKEQEDFFTNLKGGGWEHERRSYNKLYEIFFFGVEIEVYKKCSLVWKAM